MKLKYKYYINTENGLIYRCTKKMHGAFLLSCTAVWDIPGRLKYPRDFAKDRCKPTTKKFVDKIIAAGSYDKEAFKTRPKGEV